MNKGGNFMSEEYIEIEKDKEYSRSETISKIRRLADALEQNKAFEIQVDHQRIYVPANALIEFEYEREGDEEELEIEIKWKKR